MDLTKRADEDLIQGKLQLEGVISRILVRIRSRGKHRCRCVPVKSLIPPRDPSLYDASSVLPTDSVCAHSLMSLLSRICPVPLRHVTVMRCESLSLLLPHAALYLVQHFQFLNLVQNKTKRPRVQFLTTVHPRSVNSHSACCDASCNPLLILASLSTATPRLKFTRRTP